MKSWVFGFALLLLALAASAGNAQEECPSGKPIRLISTITPVLGKSPLWVTTGSHPVSWESPTKPAQALWIRDLSVKGPLLLTGKRRGGTEPAKFARALYGLPEERFKFDLLGVKPASVKEADLERYSFHRTYIWFPLPGCYEMSARLGPQQALIYINVVAAKMPTSP